MKKFPIAVLLLSSLLFMACTEHDKATGEGSEITKAGGAEETINLPFPEDGVTEEWSGQECGSTTYPCPPYGLKLYQRIEEFPFIPVGDSADLLVNEAGLATTRSLYQLREKGYKLLFLNISTGWCGYCSIQANAVAGSVADYYKDEVAFLTVVLQNSNGVDANSSYAETYMNSKNLDGFENVFVTYDPAGLFERYMNIAAFPFNAWIDLEHMEIIGYQSTLQNFSEFATAINLQMSKLK